MNKKRIGSSFDSFLDEMGIKEDVQLRALKKVLTDQIATKMERENVGKTQLAKKMKTSRSQLDRLLDPEDTGFTFMTLAKVSHALDLDLLLALNDKKKRSSKTSSKAR